MTKKMSVSDPLGNCGLLIDKSTDDNPLFIVKRTSASKPVPAWILERRLLSEQQSEENILKSVITDWKRENNGKKESES
jgi:hypothetical protein